jgi:hypothetical protein
MSFLTIFTAPKPFTDPHINIIQRNAIQSWLHIGDAVEVLLMGDEEGVAEVAVEYGVRHFPGVACNQSGVPLISAMFDLTRKVSDSHMMAVVNADILLLPDFFTTARRVIEMTDEFMLAGRRWDLNVTAPLDFSEGWSERLRQEAFSRGELHELSGSDYFIFPRKVFRTIPNFTIGRAGWDNWMIYHAVKQPWPAINASSSIMIVHQNHDYSHLPGGSAHYKMEETFENLEMAGGYKNMYTLIEVDYLLVDGHIRPAGFSLLRLIRWFELIFIPESRSPSGFRWGLTRRLRRLRRRLSR